MNNLAKQTSETESRSTHRIGEPANVLNHCGSGVPAQGIIKAIDAVRHNVTVEIDGKQHAYSMGNVQSLPPPPPQPTASTATPWTYLKRKTLIHIESGMDALSAGEPVCSLPVSKEADAALIVRAVNCHAELVTALKIAQIVVKVAARKGLAPSAAENTVNAALARAEGGGS